MKAAILTGEVNTGKSTTAFNCFCSLPDNLRHKTGGVLLLPYESDSSLQPKYWSVRELRTGNQYLINPDSEINTVRAGKFLLSNDAFFQINRSVIRDIPCCDLLILDELGFLESSCQGIFPGFTSALSCGKNLLCLVRKRLVPDYLRKISVCCPAVSVIDFFQADKISEFMHNAFET